MSSASASPHGFVVVRGRGYRPAQADACAEALSQERDAAWERAARLTVLAREMGTELERLRETVAGLAPQDYEALGERARRLFQLGQEEAEALREGARRAAESLMADARDYARGVRETARAHADAVRAEADEWARQRLLAARAEADGMRVAARREVKAGRAEALAALREMRARTTGMLDEQSREHAERGAAAEQAEAERVKALDAHHAELLARAEREMGEAERALADAEAAAARRQEEARARAAEVVAEARVRQERIARETERVLREHGDRWDDVQAHMDSARSSLRSLTGRAVE
ncbi:cellulose-binding protein [Streptomyces lancefieldiae]|uniref:Cellulose-binding protein n=1 Tax=Streptomyces lancefieldiae TaxID=3075520 RepID=A0ABU3AJ09_9ACTN|nr:cellulose-binding protein [Streptomyces sp. DSM 40712]MDT0609974.1 cellulose-binding protein [Streptomyces sp. DSM 40712]